MSIDHSAMSPVELTIIVAATKSMGIGRAGTLPWTGLKKEMAYFARVTKHIPASAPTGAQNVLIIGRKTWDSIPAKFRPLKDRLNIVLSRSYPSTAAPPPPPSSSSNSSTSTSLKPESIQLSSLSAALSYISSSPAPIGNVFVIGGAEIYRAALATIEVRRVLLTSVDGDFDCDAHLDTLRLDEGWRRCEQLEMDAWTGEMVPRGVQEEGGTQYEFQMWERKD